MTAAYLMDGSVSSGLPVDSRGSEQAWLDTFSVSEKSEI